jgi:hypothetical protein
MNNDLTGDFLAFLTGCPFSRSNLAWPNKNSPVPSKPKHRQPLDFRNLLPLDLPLDRFNKCAQSYRYRFRPVRLSLYLVLR